MEAAAEGGNGGKRLRRWLREVKTLEISFCFSLSLFCTENTVSEKQVTAIYMAPLYRNQRSPQLTNRFNELDEIEPNWNPRATAAAQSPLNRPSPSTVALDQRRSSSLQPRSLHAQIAGRTASAANSPVTSQIESRHCQEPPLLQTPCSLTLSQSHAYARKKNERIEHMRSRLTVTVTIAAVTSAATVAVTIAATIAVTAIYRSRRKVEKKEEGDKEEERKRGRKRRGGEKRRNGGDGLGKKEGKERREENVAEPKEKERKEKGRKEGKGGR
ncbi:hypothetical protein DM860_017200 [Cuscuta australis]|uniref:Uncharacterized protein n=1 Tax=Cuscuta australis TaxID=267555 RepID=A0A328DVE1_9ASTE|nr:hypothetical protein DM860_017200 [Cuscuta australis]